MLKAKLSLAVVLGTVLFPTLLSGRMLTDSVCRGDAKEKTTLSIEICHANGNSETFFKLLTINALEDETGLDQRTVRGVLLAALAEWPHCNYGQLRAAYAQGELTISPTTHPTAGTVYVVNYGGIEITVLIAI